MWLVFISSFSVIFVADKTLRDSDLTETLINIENNADVRLEFAKS